MPKKSKPTEQARADAIKKDALRLLANIEFSKTSNL
jgi:hypothetical protein